MNLIELISGIFKPAADLIDELHTSEEERLNAKANLLDVQSQVVQSAIEQAQKDLEQRASIVRAEAQSDHWLAANWRPITMLTFLGLVVVDFGTQTFTGKDTLIIDEMWTLLQIGLGGYVAGRSVEKTMKIYRDSKQ